VNDAAERKVLEALRFAMRIWSLGMGAASLTGFTMWVVDRRTSSIVQWGPLLAFVPVFALFVAALLAERWLRRGLMGHRDDLRRGIVAVTVGSLVAAMAVLLYVCLRIAIGGLS
jgi:hypothetical protein